MKLLTHSSEVKKESGMRPRGEPANEEKLVLIITSVIIVPALNLVHHPGLGVLHEGVETITTLLLRDLAKAAKVQNFRRRWHQPVLHLIQNKKPS